MYVKTVRIDRKAVASRSARPAESAGSEFEKKRKDMLKAVGAAVKLPWSSFPGKAWERLDCRCILTLVPRLRLGTNRSSPTCNHRQASWLPGIIPCARISPMQRIINITAFDWIIVNILKFLPHHFIILNHLRMNAFLP
jgi:hypothetical protein